MKDLNKVIMSGRLGQDAELKYSRAGNPILTYSLCVNRSVKEGDGYKEEANFFQCVQFGKLGESVAKYMTKGRKVTIEGELQQQNWIDKVSGQKRSAVKIVAWMSWLGEAPRGQESARPRDEYSHDVYDDSSAPTDQPLFEDDNIF